MLLAPAAAKGLEHRGPPAPDAPPREASRRPRRT